MHLPFLTELPGFQVTAVCDISPRVVEHVSERFGVERRFTNAEVLLAHADVDAVVIATPIHSDPAIAAARAGEPLTAPFYGSRVTGALAHTQGGLRIDPTCRGLREDNTPIEGLYAVGGTAVGMSGNGPEGYLSGNGPYNSHSHWRTAPGVILPLLLVDQNLVVIVGSTKAWNTSSGGLRMSMPTFTIGICVRWRAFTDMVIHLSAGAFALQPPPSGVPAAARFSAIRRSTPTVVWYAASVTPSVIRVRMASTCLAAASRAA
jgi:hypothetical protein